MATLKSFFQTQTQSNQYGQTYAGDVESAGLKAIYIFGMHLFEKQVNEWFEWTSLQIISTAETIKMASPSIRHVTVTMRGGHGTESEAHTPISCSPIVSFIILSTDVV